MAKPTADKRILASRPPAHPVAEHEPEPADDPIAEHDRPLPSPRCWIAHARLRRDGTFTQAPPETALEVFAVCVHEAFPARPAERLALMQQVVRSRTPQGPSLWVFPAGYFGFDARLFALRDPVHRPWAHPADLPRVEDAVLRDVLPLCPADATIVFGADVLDRQFACVLRQTQVGQSLPPLRIERGRTPLSGRRFVAGGVMASVFVCGEFCGSRSPANGSFFEPEGQYLTDPRTQLADTSLLIDLAHSRVPGTVSSAPAPQRYPHQRQLEKFAGSHVSGVLVHHHAGEKIWGRPSCRHQSSWMIFPQHGRGVWLDQLDPGAVTELS